MRFTVCDSLTGRILTTLQPHAWELGDPLRKPGTGSLTVALPNDPAQVQQLVEFTRPRRRWVAVADDTGRFIFGGPIPRKPARSGGSVVIPLVDWRAWFYRAPLRPVNDSTRRQYLVKNRRQDLIWHDLTTLALDTPGAPRIVVDTPPDGEVPRERTFQMLDRNIGDYLDTLVDTERGIEWWTYIATDPTDPLALVPHVTMAYPERSSRPAPVRLEYRLGAGGNASDYTWPEGGEGFTRVWAIGDGEPPDQAWASDELPDIEAGQEVVWEHTIGPLDGVKKSATAFEHAYAELQRSQGRQGTAEFSLTAEKLPLGDVFPGDRARLLFADGWEDLDLPAARIISITRSGGRGQATLSKLSLDLADAVPLEADEPGEAVSL